VNCSKDNLDDIIKLLDLESKGVSVVVKGFDAKKEKLIARYNPVTCRISVLKDIIPYWFVLFTTLLHEYGHHRQRRWFVVSFLLIGLTCVLGIWVYSLFIPYGFWVPFLIALLSVLTVERKAIHHVTELDADRYMAQHSPCIFRFLSQLETIEFIQSTGVEKKIIQKQLCILHRLYRDCYLSIIRINEIRNSV
jgi:hypothetical protein